MPRKSQTSHPSALTPSSPTSTSHPGPSVGGDTSLISNATTATTATTANLEPKSPTTKSSKKHDQDSVGIDDLLLPRTLISRLARGVLPPNTSLQRDAILAITKSATVFISYLAAHANEQTSKKTISSQDVLRAVREIEMSGVMGMDGAGGLGRLEREISMWEEGVRGKRRGYREKVKARESGAGQGVEGSDAGRAAEGGDERGEPERKKVRRGSEDVDEEDLLDQQLNGPGGAADVDVDEEDEGENDEMKEDEADAEDGQEEGEDEAEDDEQDPGVDSQEEEDRAHLEDMRRVFLGPNGRVEGVSEDESD